jgi:hypothetical protein
MQSILPFVESLSNHDRRDQRKCGRNTFLNRHSRVGGNPARCYWIPDQVRNDGFKNGFLETLNQRNQGDRYQCLRTVRSFDRLKTNGLIIRGGENRHPGQ